MKNEIEPFLAIDKTRIGTNKEGNHACDILKLNIIFTPRQKSTVMNAIQEVGKSYLLEAYHHEKVTKG